RGAGSGEREAPSTDTELGTPNGRFVSAAVDTDLHAAAAESGVPLPADGVEVASPRQLAFGGRIASLGAAERRALLDRSTSSDEAVHARTAAIVARVRQEGDAALFALARERDRVALASL